MTSRFELFIAILLSICTLVIVTIVITDVLSHQIYFSIFIGFPSGVIAAIIIFFSSKYLLRKLN